MHNHKGIKVNIKSLDGPKLKIQTQEVEKTSFEVSVVWKHSALKAVQCKLHRGFVGRSQLFIFTHC